MRTVISAYFGLAAIFAAGTAASAADLPVKAPPPPVPVLNWTGFYIGANAGWLRQKDDGSSNFFSANSPAIQTNNPQLNSLTDSSFVGGVHAGYNWQINQWLLGIEADWDWTNGKNSFCRQTDVLSAACVDNGFGFLTFTSETDWIATLR